MPAVRDIISESYILRESVGGDAFAEWWRASSIFHASNYLVRFVRERYSSDEAARVAFTRLAKARINALSPSILGLVEVGTHKGRPFLVSEYEDHRNLRSVLDSGRRFSVEQSCRLSIALAEGFESFHRRGESFGALSPESVVIHQSGEYIDEAKLLLPGYELFFGSVPKEEIPDYVSSWAYAAPELKKGKPTGPKSDLYSLGVLLFRLLVGKLPYGSRSGVKTRDRSASPSHVAAALARRGMPKELAAAVVRSLRRNPALRHPDALSLITELRAILDVRREAWLRAGKVDPSAELATLNLKKAKADAKEIVRSLETVNYFRFIAESGNDPERKPIETVEADDRTLELEEREAERDDDDDSIATDAYVEAGYAAVGEPRRLKPQPRESAPTKPIGTAPADATATVPEAKAPSAVPLAVLEPIPPKRADQGQAQSIAQASYWNAVPGPSPGTTGQPAKQGSAYSPIVPSSAPQEIPREMPALSLSATDDSLGAEQGDPPRSAPAIPAKAGASSSSANTGATMSELSPIKYGEGTVETIARNALAKRRHAPIHWKQSGGSPGDVVAKMHSAVEMAKSGTGLVRFIESPTTSEAAKVIAEGLNRLRSSAELIDLGALDEGLTLENLIPTIEERSGGRFNLSNGAPARKLRTTTSGGGDKLRVSAAVRRTSEQAAETMVSGINPERPLVVIARGTAAIAPSSHAFFIELAKAAVRAPICAFLFFGPGPIPAWHVLSAIKRNKR